MLIISPRQPDTDITTVNNNEQLELQGAVHAVDSMVCKTPDEKKV